MCAARAPPAAASSAPHEWRYRAEGGVHAVFAYAGAARALRGAVLRVRKRRASDGEVRLSAPAARVGGCQGRHFGREVCVCVSDSPPRATAPQGRRREARPLARKHL